MKNQRTTNEHTNDKSVRLMNTSHEWKPDAESHKQREPYLLVVYTEDIIFLLNKSEHILSSIECASGGYHINHDDEIITKEPEHTFTHQNVQPGEMVKITDHVILFHDDFELTYLITVETPEWGTLELYFTSLLGSTDDRVILWDSGEKGEFTKLRVIS